MEINNALALTPGELSTYLLDALFTMDCEGTLFPGLTQPEAGALVLSGCVAPIGYRRGVNQGVYGEAHRTVARGPGLGEQPVSRSPEDMALRQQLEPLWRPLSDLFKEERLFQAKLFGMLDLLRSADPLTDADRQQAEQLFKASQALFYHHAKAIKPLL